MSEEALEALSDMASEAHARIQKKHRHINPVIGVRRGMRDVGIPADAMTIDCLRTRRRIVLVLHDAEAGMLLYQFASIDTDIGDDFERMAFSDVQVQTLFDWIQDYFDVDAPTNPVY